MPSFWMKPFQHTARCSTKGRLRSSNEGCSLSKAQGDRPHLLVCCRKTPWYPGSLHLPGQSLRLGRRKTAAGRPEATSSWRTSRSFSPVRFWMFWRHLIRQDACSGVIGADAAGRYTPKTATRRFRLFFPTISRITTWNANYPKINERFSSFKRCSHGAAWHAPKNMYMHILRACLPWNPIR